MSTQADVAVFVGICLMGLIAPNDAYHAAYVAGLGAVGGGLLISIFPTKKLTFKERAGRWGINTLCGVGFGTITGAVLTDLMPSIPVPIVMFTSGFALGCLGVATLLLLKASLKRELKGFLKVTITSMLTNVLHAINKPNAPDSRDGK